MPNVELRRVVVLYNDGFGSFWNDWIGEAVLNLNLFKLGFMHFVEESYIIHFILFILIIFDNSKAGMVVSNALSTGLFTLFLALTLTTLFSRKEK